MVYHHIEHITAEAQYSVCGQYRYRLTIQHGTKKDGKTVCVIMQNPSVAGNTVADKSVQFLEKLIFRMKYPQFEEVARVIIVNQFARIQTRDFKGSPDEASTKNDSHIRNAIQESDSILIAWGKSNPYMERQETILNMVREYPGRNVMITKKHPSRGSYENFIEPFPV